MALRRGRGCCFQPGQTPHSKDHRWVVFIVSESRVILNPEVLQTHKQENGLDEASYTVHTLHCITTTVLLQSTMKKDTPTSAYTYTIPYARVVMQANSFKLPTAFHQGSNEEAALPRTWLTTLDPDRRHYVIIQKRLLGQYLVDQSDSHFFSLKNQND